MVYGCRISTAALGRNGPAVRRPATRRQRRRGNGWASGRGRRGAAWPPAPLPTASTITRHGGASRRPGSPPLPDCRWPRLMFIRSAFPPYCAVGQGAGCKPVHVTLCRARWVRLMGTKAWPLYARRAASEQRCGLRPPKGRVPETSGDGRGTNEAPRASRVRPGKIRSARAMPWPGW